MQAANTPPFRTLITGGAGFIGSHLAETLLERGHQVTIIDDLSTGRFENIQHLTSHPKFHFAIDTITNEVVMDRLASECDVIYHLAAAVGVMLIVEKPVHTISTNIMGTEAVLKAALRYHAKVLLASSSEVYGKGNRVPFQEDDDVVLGPTSRSRWSYAASKMADEFLALAYWKEYQLPVVVCRLFNTVGPRQTGRYGMVIPRFIQQAIDGEPLAVFGDGTQSRCFLHVRDAVEGLLTLADHPQAIGNVFNIGSTEEISISQLAQKIIHLMTEYVHLDRFGNTQKSNQDHVIYIPYEQAYTTGFEDMHRRIPDISKITLATGWRPHFDLDHTLREIIQYHLDNPSTNKDHASYLTSRK